MTPVRLPSGMASRILPLGLCAALFGPFGPSVCRTVAAVDLASARVLLEIVRMSPLILQILGK
jgi:hypothetical protein